MGLGEKSQFRFRFCSFFMCAEGRKSGIKSQTSNANSNNYKCGVSAEDLDGGIKVGVIGNRKKILCSRLSFKIKEKISPLTARIHHPEVFFTRIQVVEVRGS